MASNDVLLATAGLAKGVQNIVLPYMHYRWQRQNQELQGQSNLRNAKELAGYEAGLRPRPKHMVLNPDGSIGNTIEGDPGQPMSFSKIDTPKVGGDPNDRSYLASRYDKSAGVFNQVKEGYGRVAASTRGTAAGDMSLIFGIMKMLDPNSTVREGEYATAQQAGSVPERVRAQYNKALKGDFLDPSQRKDFVQQAQNLWTNAKREHQSTNTRFEFESKKMNVDPGSFLIPASAEAEGDLSTFLKDNNVRGAVGVTPGMIRRPVVGRNQSGMNSLVDELIQEYNR